MNKTTWYYVGLTLMSKSVVVRADRIVAFYDNPHTGLYSGNTVILLDSIHDGNGKLYVDETPHEILKLLNELTAG